MLPFLISFTWDPDCRVTLRGLSSLDEPPFYYWMVRKKIFLLFTFLQCEGTVTIADFFERDGAVRAWHGDRVEGDQEEVRIVEENKVGEILVQVEQQALRSQVNPNRFRINQCMAPFMKKTASKMHVATWIYVKWLFLSV